MDITVCIKDSKWENIIDCLQPGNINNQSCLKNKIHKEICQHGYHLVPFISDRGHIQWRISTSYLETQILSKCSKDSSFKRIIILKSKKDQYLKYSPPKIVSLIRNLQVFWNFIIFMREKIMMKIFWNLVLFFIKNVIVQALWICISCTMESCFLEFSLYYNSVISLQSNRRTKLLEFLYSLTKIKCTRI